jgi:hypothetical protein
VPGPPANKTALPAILCDLMRSTTTPHACLGSQLSDQPCDTQYTFCGCFCSPCQLPPELLTSRAAVWPTKPAACFSAMPFAFRPRPLMWVCAAVRLSRLLPRTSLIWTMVGLCRLETAVDGAVELSRQRGDVSIGESGDRRSYRRSGDSWGIDGGWVLTEWVDLSWALSSRLKVFFRAVGRLDAAELAWTRAVGARRGWKSCWSVHTVWGITNRTHMAC